jgi:hypothetical protein
MSNYATTERPKFAYEKIICARRRPNRPVFDGGRCDIELVAREDGKVRGSPSWHKTVVPFASGQFYTDSGRLTDALCP